jgi:hypothetical protein
MHTWPMAIGRAGQIGRNRNARRIIVILLYQSGGLDMQHKTRFRVFRGLA